MATTWVCRGDNVWTFLYITTVVKRIEQSIFGFQALLLPVFVNCLYRIRLRDIHRREQRRPSVIYIFVCRQRHDDVIKWKHFPCYWPFVRWIHWSLVTSPHKGQCRRALMLSSICAWMNDWVNNREAGDLRRHHAHYNVTVMEPKDWKAPYLI